MTMSPRKTFRTLTEPETGAILISTRRSPAIVEGRLTGSEILFQDGLYRVWTGRVRLVRELAKRHGLRARIYDGEAELRVPEGLADLLLPRFGARTRRLLTDTEKAERIRRLQGPRKALYFAPDAQKNGLPGALNGPNASTDMGGSK